MPIRQIEAVLGKSVRSSFFGLSVVSDINKPGKQV